MKTKLLDWKNYKHAWPYRGDETNKKYLKDRTKFFEGQNGWFRLTRDAPVQSKKKPEDYPDTHKIIW